MNADDNPPLTIRDSKFGNTNTFTKMSRQQSLFFECNKPTKKRVSKNSKLAVIPLRIKLHVNSSVVAFGMNVKRCLSTQSMNPQPIAVANILLYLSSILFYCFDSINIPQQSNKSKSNLICINYSVITDREANRNNLHNCDNKHANTLIKTVLYAPCSASDFALYTTKKGPKARRRQLIKSTIQVQDPQKKQRKHFPKNRLSLWDSFNDFWTPVGTQFQFQPNEQPIDSTPPTFKRSSNLDAKVTQIHKSIDQKVKILEDAFQPKKIKIETFYTQKREFQPRISVSIVNITRQQSRQTTRVQSASPMMRKSKKQTKHLTLHDTIGLQIEKCNIYNRIPKERIRLDYQVVPYRRRQSTPLPQRQSRNYEYKKSITLAKWDQSEVSYELF